jgi:hypothetical protein
MRLGRAVLLAAPIAGLAELAAHLWLAKRPPAFEDWASVRAPVLAFADASLPVVVAPRWAEPMARQALGDERMPVEQVARPDTSRFERAVELSILGQRAPELEGWEEETREKHGKFELRRLHNPGFRRVLVDFVERARPPFADVRLTEPAETCRWNEHARTMAGGLGGNATFAPQRFECPSGVFFNVGATVIADQDFLPRRCLWSHPPRTGEIVTRFGDVALGDTIEGHGGMYWMMEREGKYAPVTLRVRVDGEEIGALVHRDGDGWAAFRFELGKHAREEHAKVEFGVSTPNYLHRHFCFEATSR